MTLNDTIELMAMIQSSYSGWNPKGDKRLLATLWTELLEPYSKTQVIAAFKNYMLTDTTGYAPMPGHLVQRIQSQQDTNSNGEEAWEKVLKALRNSSYHAEEEFEKLPEVIQKAIGGNPGCLRTLAIMDMNTLNSVEKSHFLKTYSEELSRVRKNKLCGDKLLNDMGDSRDMISDKN